VFNVRLSAIGRPEKVHPTDCLFPTAPFSLLPRLHLGLVLLRRVLLHLRLQRGPRGGAAREGGLHRVHGARGAVEGALRVRAVLPLEDLVLIPREDDGLVELLAAEFAEGAGGRVRRLRRRVVLRALLAYAGKGKEKRSERNGSAR